MITMFIGWPGTGKTQAMIDYVRDHSDSHRFFVVDRAAEWGILDHNNLPNPRWRKDPPRIILVEDRESMSFEDTGVYLFRHPWESAEVAQLAIDVGNTVYTDDEIDVSASIAGWQSNPLREIVHRGRHLPNADGDVLEAHILGAARRPQSIHPDLTAIADQAFIFRTSGSLTLNRFKSDAWIEDDEWDKIRALPNLQFKHWPSGKYLSMKDPFKKR